MANEDLIWDVEGGPVIIGGDGGEPVTVQNPFPVGGDSVYCQDVDAGRSSSVNWVGDICDIYSGLHTEIYNDTSDNPKTILTHFIRTTEFGAITIGNAEGGTFSNVRITAINPGLVLNIVVDETSDDTKHTFRAYDFGKIYSVDALKIEFLTADRVGVTVVSIPTARTVKVDTNNIETPIHVIDTDSSKRIAANTIFGDRVTGQKKASLAYQFNYGYRERDFNIQQINGATVAAADSLVVLSTGTHVAGKAIMESVGYLRYIPGNEAYVFFTAVFTTPKADSYQRAGLFDDDDGFFVGYEGTDFKITRRRNTVDTSLTIDVSKVLPLEAYDPTLGNVYKISFGYLGFATINFEMLSPDGSWVNIGSIDYPNTSTTTHIANTNLPVRGEIANTGNATDMTLSSGSISAGIVNGGDEDPSARPYTYERGPVDTDAGNNMLVAFRNVTTFNGRTNRIKAVAQLVTAATEGNKPVSWAIVFNPTITNTPVWVATDADSIMEVSTDAVITFGTGTPGVSWNMAKEDSFFEIVETLGGSIMPGDVAVIVVASTGSSATEFSMRWKELF